MKGAGEEVWDERSIDVFKGETLRFSAVRGRWHEERTLRHWEPKLKRGKEAGTTATPPAAAGVPGSLAPDIRHVHP